MSTLIKCEFIKIKHSLGLLSLLILALIPILINLARPLMIRQKYTLFDLYFPLFNQYSLFFPLVLMMLTATIFYIEYQNGTYIDWITYGYSKIALVTSKLIVAVILAMVFITIDFTIMTIGLVWWVPMSLHGFIKMAASFWLFSLMAVLINIPLSAIVINMTRNAIVTAIFSIILMIVNAIFMAAPFGYYIPSVFAYRLGLLPIAQSDFYTNTSVALTVGTILASICILILFVMTIGQFSWRRKIES
ncbi:ABC transporter permease [Lentilactobacillus kisonensis]|uniref:Uncharacterized protein n=1 Tax=Lentilactobacillus kisonensis F0435 TaxID=797516 RepID=H1LCJ8_9LACO|nr:ABC transporter permease [Lentilactobacillus kisonensis]EHO53977.1 hypothetical protein HMPREF9104_00311 [Lentilactobacillus kisonensis F0435]